MKNIHPFSRRRFFALRSISGLALLFCAAPLAAQTEWIQNTTVRRQNSNKEPVPNAHVVFDGAPTKFSDQDGKVRLAFSNKKPGTYTFLVELTKEGYELVNNKDFENIKLSADDQLGVDLILAKTGVVDAAKKEYYDISDRSLKAGFEREKAKIRRERDEAKITAQHFEEQWKQLQEQYDNQKKELDVLAEKFARVNFDDVDSLYRQALELFKEGKIDAAIEMLENAEPFKLIEQIIGQEAQDADDQKKLDARKQATSKTKQKIIAQVRLLADMYGVKFNPAKAEALFDGLVRLDSTDLEILQDAANFYRKNHRYEKALHILPLIIAHPQAEDWQKVSSHAFLGDMYTALGQLEFAMKAYLACQNGCLNLIKRNPSSTTYKAYLASSFSKLGLTQKALGNLDGALTHFKKNIILSYSLYENNLKNMDLKHGLAMAHEFLGLTYTSMGNLDSSLFHFEKYNQLEKELHGAYPNQPEFKHGLAISYQFIGNIHNTKGDLNSALQQYERYHYLQNELYETYPQNLDFKNGVAISYSKLGLTHSALGSLEKALVSFKHFNQLEKELHDEYPRNVHFKNGLAISYEYLGKTYTTLKQLDTALMFFERSFEISRLLYEAYPKNVDFKNGLALSYAKLGETHAALGNLNIAFQSYEKYNQLEKELCKDYPKNIDFKNGLAHSYGKMGIFSADKLHDMDRAKNYLQEAHILWSELVREAPDNIQFQQSLKKTRQNLAEVRY